MDLPVWQALYQELEAKNFVPIAVAFDSAGNLAAEPRTGRTGVFQTCCSPGPREPAQTVR